MESHESDHNCPLPICTLPSVVLHWQSIHKPLCRVKLIFYIYFIVLFSSPFCLLVKMLSCDVVFLTIWHFVAVFLLKQQSGQSFSLRLSSFLLFNIRNTEQSKTQERTRKYYNRLKSRVVINSRNLFMKYILGMHAKRPAWRRGSWQKRQTWTEFIILIAPYLTRIAIQKF